MSSLRKVGQTLLAGWKKLGELLNKLFSPVILGATYFLLLTPIALLYRLFRPKNSKESTTLVDRNKEFTPVDFDNPW